MKLTEERKQKIDNLSYKSLLTVWRSATEDNKWVQGETGDYWSKRLMKLRTQPGGEDLHKKISKEIGWDGKKGLADKKDEKGKKRKTQS